MNCQAFRSVADDLFDGSLGSEGEQQARAHLTQCAKCRQDFEELTTAIAALRCAPETAVPEDMWRSFRVYAARRDAMLPVSLWDRIFGPWRRTLSAACLGMIMFITVVSSNATRALQKYVVPVA